MLKVPNPYQLQVLTIIQTNDKEYYPIPPEVKIERKLPSGSTELA